MGRAKLPCDANPLAKFIVDVEVLARNETLSAEPINEPA